MPTHRQSIEDRARLDSTSDATRLEPSPTRGLLVDSSLVAPSRLLEVEPLSLARPCPLPILALGSRRQSSYALGWGRNAILGLRHVDLSDPANLDQFSNSVDDLARRLQVEPGVVAHDFDPDDVSSRLAEGRGIPSLAVQHHHAHVASCMAENNLEGTVLGVVLDADGLGGDGATWGGEFLLSTYEAFRRVGQFRYVPMPGGEAAVLEPWRMALAYLDDACLSLEELGDRVKPFERREVESSIRRRLDAPSSSSVARLFDAVAVLAGLAREVRHEGQLADELEWLASEVEPDITYPFAFDASEDRPRLVVDTRPMIEEIVADLREGVSPGQVGRRFHSTLVEMIARTCLRLRVAHSVNTVALSGSVFLNELLLSEVSARLTHHGFDVYDHHRVPTHDGGLALGQLAVTSARLARTI